MFNTTVDIKLRQWADIQLPQKSVEAGWEALRHEFSQFIERGKQNKNHDDLFDNLKSSVVEDVMSRHRWEEKVSR